MSASHRPVAVLIHRPTVTRDPRGHIVISAEVDAQPWSRALGARAARTLWDGLTTRLFGGAGEKFIHVAQTAMIKPETDPGVSDWIRLSEDPSGLLVIRGLSTLAPNEQNWIARLTLQDAQKIWRELEALLFAEIHGRVRAPSASATPPESLPATGPARRMVHVTPEVRVAVEDYPGPQPSLLFVHGAFCDHSIWRYQTAFFAANHRCVSVDLRGHGASDKPLGSYLPEVWADDLTRVIAALGLKSPVVVGHSLGASAALELAARGAPALGGLVLIEPAVIVDEREAELFAQYTLGEPGTPDFSRRFVNRVANLIGDDLTPTLAEPLRRVMLATPPHVAAGLDEATFMFATGPIAVRVHVPALVLLAVHRSEDASFFSRYLRGSDVRLLQDVSHFPMLATPGRVNAAISEFLQKTGGSPPVT
jgi:pimeloyl-ACP methyl ester carboxylesterase